jgi:hypothetical protein
LAQLGAHMRYRPVGPLKRFATDLMVLSIRVCGFYESNEIVLEATLHIG